MMSDAPAAGLRVHGDSFARHGVLDFAVNVWPAPRPERLRKVIDAAMQETGYPDEGNARAAIARAHRRPVEEVLPLAGACEAFWLIAHALKISHAVCVHPSFTEGEASLRQTHTRVTQVMRLPDEWALDPGGVPDDADLVILANPNNPTGTLEDPAGISRLARTGRILVVDESFIDFVEGDGWSLADRRDVPGLLVLRSLTKAWGLAGLRAGYLLGPPGVVERLAAHRQPWSVSTAALAAIAECVGDAEWPARVAAEVAVHRRDLSDRLANIPGVTVWPSAANFVLVEVPGRGPAIVDSLASAGIAVRPCESFPGLGEDHIRLAVRSPAEHEALAGAIALALSANAPMHRGAVPGAPSSAGPRAPVETHA
jgi:histidinol-phosphate aminotransferase